MMIVIIQIEKAVNGRASKRATSVVFDIGEKMRRMMMMIGNVRAGAVCSRSMKRHSQ